MAASWCISDGYRKDQARLFRNTHRSDQPVQVNEWYHQSRSQRSARSPGAPKLLQLLLTPSCWLSCSLTQLFKSQRANKTLRNMSTSATTVWMARHGEVSAFASAQAARGRPCNRLLHFPRVDSKATAAQPTLRKL